MPKTRRKKRLREGSVEPPPTPPPGQVAYEAFEKRYGANFHKRPSPPWDELEEIKQDAWNVAAVALQVQIHKDLPETTVLVEKDTGAEDHEKRAWSPQCPKCTNPGRPIRGEGEYATAKYCRACDVLFGWQLPVEPPWSAA